MQEYVALYGPLVLLFDDVHHFDAASWRLLAAATATGALAGRALFVLGLRPLSEPASPESPARAQHATASRVQDSLQVGPTFRVLDIHGSQDLGSRSKCHLGSSVALVLLRVGRC